jgi:putative transposase
MWRTLAASIDFCVRFTKISSAMSEYRKTEPSELYFITLTVVGWIDVFSRKDYRDIVVENLRYCQQKLGLEIFAYVIMSNHLHLIARRQEGDLTELLGRFKSFVSKRVLEAIKGNAQESRKDWLLYLFGHFAKSNRQYSDYHFWNYTNHPTLLDKNTIIDQKVEYIHMNPVRAGLVSEPEHYIYSSASPNSPLEVCEI